MGDSHTAVFEYINGHVWFPGFFFQSLIIHGATASGLDNPNSKTQTRKKLDNFISANNFRNQALLIQLGEVDCGFVIWYRAEKYNIPVEDSLNTTLFKYQQFLMGLKNKAKRLIVMSAVLPTIQDGRYFGEIANLRREVKANLKERTALTIQFNVSMEQFCLLNNINFLNLDHLLLDNETGTVKKVFLNEDPLDHHLSNKKIYPILLSSIKSLVKQF